jgi:hypothetical protein
MPEVSSSVAIFYFIAVFLAYSYYKYTKNGEISPGINILIFLILVIGEGFINLGISSGICQGAAQPSSALVATIFPWFLVLGLLKIMLALMPGWLIPFENTFGYLFVSIVTDLKDVFNDILTPQYNLDPAKKVQGGGGGDAGGVGGVGAAGGGEGELLEKMQKRDIGRALEQIYSDQSILLNELNLENLDAFWKGFTESSLIKPDKEESKDKIKKFILLKSIVGEFVWLILTGFLVVSISYNYLLNIGCTYTKEQQQVRAAALAKAQKDAADAAAAAAADTKKIK